MRLYPFDSFGNIALVKFPKDFSEKKKKQYAKEILQSNKSIKTILEKTDKFKGRLRKQKTKYLLGEKTKEVLYNENNCSFRFNIDDTYFSPRLSNERKEIALQIKKDDIVLVMFAGVAPLPIVIAKNSKAKKIYSNEINRKANQYAKINIENNKLKEKVFLLPGDIKKVASELNKKKMKFDAIAMPRPQLKDSFLKEAFMLSKKNTRVYYYDFCRETKEEESRIIKKIKDHALRSRKKVEILKMKKAGEIGPRRMRIRVDFKVN